MTMWNYKVFRGTTMVYDHHTVPPAKTQQENDYCLQTRIKTGERLHWYMHRGLQGWRTIEHDELPKDLKLLILLLP